MAFDRLRINTSYHLPDDAISKSKIDLSAYNTWRTRMCFEWEPKINETNFGWLTHCEELRAEVAVLDGVAKFLNRQCLSYFVGVEELIRQGVITSEQFSAAVTNGREKHFEPVRRASEYEKHIARDDVARNWATNRGQYIPLPT